MSTAQILNYEVLGSGEPVVLLHGLFGDLDNLKGLGRDLSADFQVILVDARNHGDSFHSDHMNYADMAADLAATLDALNIESAHIVGHSMGGKIAMEFALTYPKRARSVIAADISPVAYDPKHRHILDALKAIDLSTVSNRADADKQLAQHIDTRGVRQFLLKNLSREDGHYTWRINLDTLNSCYEEISGAVRQGSYDGPILFIKGGDSDYLATAHTDEIKGRFNNVEVKIIEGTGHWLHAEKPRIFNRLARAFIENHSRT
ncbi:alpha/beta fold hydrolase [Pseudidiomarina gelatinasegens]|uniref:Alpha/beta fold hydrolase n=1 Tax=Pseudidiomarina gelatinasegens TaxID=2487740 RepID=A0A451GEN9_9GAMM|nr:alpha/beta fold hydrolase [Pseudidiomarina gelatinasegens]RWU11557.1 alpha/beta fold hydrolase [Pseudidiomarina gelatinasegens]|tara:strand:- start:1508 stop:2290 length:783 start_codon:yes stop_codon:yes gene_type:complete